MMRDDEISLSAIGAGILPALPHGSEDTSETERGEVSHPSEWRNNDDAVAHQLSPKS